MAALIVPINVSKVGRWVTIHGRKQVSEVHQTQERAVDKRTVCLKGTCDGRPEAGLCGNVSAHDPLQDHAMAVVDEVAHVVCVCVCVCVCFC